MINPSRVYGPQIKNAPEFTELSEYLAYTDAIQKYIFPTSHRMSTIALDLPMVVMRAERTWDFEEKFICSFNKLGQKLYTTSIHVTMAGFEMYVHTQKVAKQNTL